MHYHTPYSTHGAVLHRKGKGGRRVAKEAEGGTGREDAGSGVGIGEGGGRGKSKKSKTGSASQDAVGIVGVDKVRVDFLWGGKGCI